MIKKCLCCWNEFDNLWTAKKYCSKKCADFVHNKQNKEGAKLRRLKDVVCRRCWINFITSSNTKYCEECKKIPNYRDHTIKRPWFFINKRWLPKAEKERIFKNCRFCWVPLSWALKKSCDSCRDKSMRCLECGVRISKWSTYCKKHKHLKEKFTCKTCWVKFTWTHNNIYCDSCRPKCETCWKKVAHTHNKCCSISCATKKKRADDYTSSLLKWHLVDIFNWKYNKWSRFSSEEKKWADFFSENWIEYETQFKLETNDWKIVFYDFKIWNKLIEINPTCTHNSTKPYRNWSKPLHYKYHFHKTSVWELNWYHVINIFDWDDNNKVKAWLLGLLWKRKRRYWSDIKQISNSQWFEFCEHNHLQGWISCTVWYGLFSKWELINVMWFTYMESSDEWHLTRFASKEWEYIAHWAEKLFKHFIQIHSPRIVISFSDRTKHTWWLYSSLWFTTSLVESPNYRWVYKWKNYWRTSCRKEMIHLLPWFKHKNKYKRNENDPYWQRSEREIMSELWYVQVYNSWNRKHVWTPKDTY